MNTLKFGLFFLCDKEPEQTDAELYAELVEESCLAEELGFDSVWIAEHHFVPHSGHCPASFLLALKIADQTRRLRVGTGVRVLPLEHPLRIAEEASMLDLLSGGRLVLGVGNGAVRAEYEGYGVSFDERRQRLYEEVEILLQAFGRGSVAFDGRYYRVGGVDVLPRPEPSLARRIWVATASADSLAWAAARHLPFIQPAIEPTDKLRANLAAYEAASDGTVQDFPMLRHVFVGASDEGARREAEAATLSLLERYLLAPGRPDALPRERFTYEYLAENYLTYGSPESCARSLRQLRDELRVSEVLCWVRKVGLTTRQVRETMRLLAREVMPAVG